MAKVQYLKVSYDFVDDEKGDIMLIIEAPKGRADDDNAKLVYNSAAHEAMLYRNSEQIIQLPIISKRAREMLLDGRTILLVTEMDGDDISDVYEAKLEIAGKLPADASGTQTVNNKKIEIENQYEIFQNKTGDIMFSILERDGEPDSPEIVYDGGAHALLCRNNGHTVILDYINPDVRPSLTHGKEVLIAEHHKTDKKNFVREYTAVVNIVKRLPEEYELLLNEYANEKEEGHDDDPDKAGERIRRMLRKDPKEAQRVVQFYIDMANDGNVGAQYELAFLYLEGLGVEKDEAKAKEWFQKAAQQGHKDAAELLDYREKNPKVIHDHGMFPKTEMPCAQCGTIIKLGKEYVDKHNLSVCPKCGAYYEYIHSEKFDGGPDEWA